MERLRFQKQQASEISAFFCCESQQWLIFTFQRGCLAGHRAKEKAPRRVPTTGTVQSRLCPHIWSSILACWSLRWSRQAVLLVIKVSCSTAHSFPPRWSLSSPRCLYVACFSSLLGVFVFCAKPSMKHFWHMLSVNDLYPWQVGCFEIPTCLTSMSGLNIDQEKVLFLSGFWSHS